MSKIGEFVVVLCLINFAYGGVTDLVPNFVKKTAAGMVPEEVTKLIYRIPDEEVIAAKRFVLEADLGVDLEKIEYLRNVLFQTLLKSANVQNPNQQMIQNQPMYQQIQYVPTQPNQNAGPANPGYLNSALNSMAQSVKPKISVALSPSLSFGN